MKEESVKYLPEYRAIQKHYGDRKAERSGVLLMQHIDEGLHILDILGASKDAKRAWCLHPLFQHNDDLQVISNNDILFSFSPRCVMLAMEYRARANDWLSDKVQKINPMVGNMMVDGNPSPGHILEVKHMLIADKVQNYKDFLLYHSGKHGRSEELNYYFQEWLKELNVGIQEYTDLICSIRAE